MSLRHFLIALLVPITWGFGVALAKSGLEHFPPLLLMGMRFLIAGAVLVWFVPIPRGYFKKISIITFIAATMQYGLTFSGLARLEATPAVLLAQSQVLFGVIIAAVILDEKPSLRQISGLVAAFAGIVTIVGAPSLAGRMTGVVLVLSGCLFWALGQVMVRGLNGVLSGFQLTAWIGVMAGLQMTIASLLIEGNPLPCIQTASPADWGTVIYLGIVMTVIGYSAWYYILARYPVPMAMPLLLFVPISTILGAITFLGEHPDFRVLMGGMMVIAGVGVVIVEPQLLFRQLRTRTRKSLSAHQPH